MSHFKLAGLVFYKQFRYWLRNAGGCLQDVDTNDYICMSKLSETKFYLILPNLHMKLNYLITMSIARPVFCGSAGAF